MSTGGNVPTQGTTTEALSDSRQQQAAQEKKRGPMGRLGKGTPGGRVRAAWRRFNRAAGAPKNMLTLKAFARRALSGNRQGPGWPTDAAPLEADVAAWLDSKRPGGGGETLAARQARLDRIAEMYAARQGKTSKAKVSVPKKETSRTAHRT